MTSLIWSHGPGLYLGKIEDIIFAWYKQLNFLLHRKIILRRVNQKNRINNSKCIIVLLVTQWKSQSINIYITL